MAGLVPIETLLLNFEFGMWISPKFKIYLIKEFQRLKQAEEEQFGWDIKRNLTKINYRIHTDAMKANLIPPELTGKQISFVYANEADVFPHGIGKISEIGLSAYG